VSTGPKKTKDTQGKSAGVPAPALAATAIAVAFAVGFLSGRVTAPDPPPPPPPRPSATRTLPPQTAVEPIAMHGGSRGPRTSDPGGPRGSALARELATPPRLEGDVDPRVARALEASRASRAAPDDHHVAEAALLAAGELETALAADPQALARAIAAFRSLTDGGDLEALAAVLGRMRDPAVEELALEVVRGDVSPARRTAALDILDAMDTPAAREVALQALSSEQDVDLRRAALRAIPEPAGASLEQAGTVVSTLTRIIAQDRDVELRRRAAVNLGTWHRNDAELQPLLDVLLRDPSPEVRSGAAFGLEVARRRSPEVVAALVAAMTKPDEDPLVRDNAWRALSALSPLPPEARTAWLAYQAEHEAAGEAGQSDQGDDGHDHGH
jgi:hypothetical protein